MSNSINTLSPSLRDALLYRNLAFAKTIEENGYTSYSEGIGKPAELYTLPQQVINGNQINNSDQLTNINLYKPVELNSIDINYIPNVNEVQNVYYDGLIINGSKLLLENENYINNLISKNEYTGESEKKIYNNIFNPINYIKYKTYGDKISPNKEIKNAIDVIGSLLDNNSVGFNNNLNIVPNFDIKGSLLGRILGGSGVINDTELGVIGAQQLYLNMLNNVTNNVLNETIGNINLNPLSLLNGNPLINLDYKITKPSSRALDIFERLTGSDLPDRGLSNDASLYHDLNPISNIERGDNILKQSGKGQVKALFDNLNQNRTKLITNNGLLGDSDALENGLGGLTLSFNNALNLDTFKRKRYVPGFDGLKGEIYVGDTGEGKFIDIMTFKNFPLPSYFTASSELINNLPNKKVNQSLFSNEFDSLNDVSSFLYPEESDIVYNDKKDISKFSWEGVNSNKTFNNSSSPDFKKKKGILYHTNRLFKSDLLRTLVNAKGFNNGLEYNEETHTLSQDRNGNNWQSKGSGVLTREAIEGNSDLSVNGENVFCRVWTKTDRYDKISKQIRHSSIDNRSSLLRFRSNSDSVLTDTGHVKIAPFNSDDISKSPKKYMFSLENLAWSAPSDFSRLLPCEQGDGDLISGSRGRVMWFPPYDIQFNEDVSVSLDETEFIGRGEPIYTYNNTRRNGTLSFMLVVDHPDIINKKSSDENINDDILASFFAGCYDLFDNVLTQEEEDEIQNLAVEVSKPIEVKKQVPPPPFTYYFPHDSSEILDEYENGNGVGLGTTKSGKFHPGKTDFYLDRTDLALNGPGNIQKFITINKDNGSEVSSIVKEIEGKPKYVITMDGVDYNGIFDPNYFPALKTYIKDKCPSCKVVAKGYANSAGKLDNNQKLSNSRADALFNKLKQEVFTPDVFGDGRFDKSGENVKIEGKGQVGKCNDETIKTIKDASKQPYDVEVCKVDRSVTIEFVYDEKLDPVAIEKRKEREIAKKRINTLLQKRLNYYCEASFFKKLSEDDPIVFDKIINKIKYFHPAFHSTTPEGFNSRLTFLHQCTRQGSTIQKKDNGEAQNLSFGRPPVCILRIGDFYNTKIFINSMSINYEPLVWDMNPEGIGVQPMIAKISLSFNFIGGSDLRTPINKLQNALSFNFYGNTSVYDLRSDIVLTNEKGENYISNGVFPNETVSKDRIDYITSLNNAQLPQININDAIVFNENNQNNIVNQENTINDIDNINIQLTNENYDSLNKNLKMTFNVINSTLPYDVDIETQLIYNGNVVLGQKTLSMSSGDSSTVNSMEIDTNILTIIDPSVDMNISTSYNCVLKYRIIKPSPFDEINKNKNITLIT